MYAGVFCFEYRIPIVFRDEWNTMEASGGNMDTEELHQENALKLQQILNLEDLLYATRIVNLDDGSPCWCVEALLTGGEHTITCTSARKATEMFWKK
jgi:hypothetical protein